MLRLLYTRRDLREAFADVEHFERLKQAGQDVDWELFLANDWLNQLLGWCEESDI